MASLSPVSSASALSYNTEPASIPAASSITKAGKNALTTKKTNTPLVADHRENKPRSQSPLNEWGISEIDAAYWEEFERRVVPRMLRGEEPPFIYANRPGPEDYDETAVVEAANPPDLDLKPVQETAPPPLSEEDFLCYYKDQIVKRENALYIVIGLEGSDVRVKNKNKNKKNLPPSLIPILDLKPIFKTDRFFRIWRQNHYETAKYIGYTSKHILFELTSNHEIINIPHKKINLTSAIPIPKDQNS